jgi:endonuclease/exonuclease/phosphatase family metal-dependent hydrolase
MRADEHSFLPKEGPAVRRLLFLATLAGLGYGGWWFHQHYEIRGLEGVSIVKRDGTFVLGAANDGWQPQTPAGAPGTAVATATPTNRPPLTGRASTIRVASFNIQVFGESKIDKPDVMNVLAEVTRRFDVVAIQEIRAKRDDIVPRFVELINSTGRKYDYVVGPRLGRTNSKEQYAFVFDTATIEVDRTALYTVSDPSDRLHREPLVGWFRARGPPPDQAFTFSLVDIHTDPDETTQELNALDEVFRAVRDDGRDEDDVIILGDLNVDDRHLGDLGEVPNIAWVISGVPTNMRGNRQYDNILFSKLATVEYTGRAGVFDLPREFNLNLDQALQVSDHMPIWAEFSAYEGGQPGRVASRFGKMTK